VPEAMPGSVHRRNGRQVCPTKTPSAETIKQNQPQAYCQTNEEQTRTYGESHEDAPAGRSSPTHRGTASGNTGTSQTTEENASRQLAVAALAYVHAGMQRKQKAGRNARAAGEAQGRFRNAGYHSVPERHECAPARMAKEGNVPATRQVQPRNKGTCRR